MDAPCCEPCLTVPSKAVSEAISVLVDDDNMDLLRQTAGFLQISSDLEEGAEAQLLRKRAASTLRKAAQAPSWIILGGSSERSLQRLNISQK